MRETRKQSEIHDNNNSDKSVAANRNRYSTISWIKKSYKWKKAQNTGLQKKYIYI